MFKGLMQKVDRLLGRGVIDDDMYEELEEALIAADVQVQIVDDIMESLRRTVRERNINHPSEMKERLQDEIASRLSIRGQAGLATAASGPTVYLFIGVNGAGKTTTIGKLAHRLTRSGKKVLLAAGDTFRAAAIDQLKIWAERTGSDFVGSKPGGDSAALIFDAIQAGIARNVDFVLADTAGRQHTKAGLMQELAKVARVTEKALGRRPDEVLLVLDGNTGQNAIRQAEEFGAAGGVSGLVLTKLDGTAKGGALLGLHDRLGIPVKLIGVGEKAENLLDF
ncbi:MAG: signal recognition particle-docking protein FtsY, partial [Fimbriimonadaceae bacterium]|nr:signal recognition particle-docking protein FtsY [Fimbriimonadaceae bacterium]